MGSARFCQTFYFDIARHFPKCSGNPASVHVHKIRNDHCCFAFDTIAKNNIEIYLTARGFKMIFSYEGSLYPKKIFSVDHSKL